MGLVHVKTLAWPADDVHDYFAVRRKLNCSPSSRNAHRDGWLWFASVVPRESSKKEEEAVPRDGRRGIAIFRVKRKPDAGAQIALRSVAKRATP